MNAPQPCVTLPFPDGDVRVRIVQGILVVDNNDSRIEVEINCTQAQEVIALFKGFVNVCRVREAPIVRSAT